MTFIVLNTILIKYKAYKPGRRRSSKRDFKETMNCIGYSIQMSNYWDVFVSNTFKKYFVEGHADGTIAEIKKEPEKKKELWRIVLRALEFSKKIGVDR